MRRLSFLLICLVAAGCALHSDYNRGRRCLDKGDYEKAAALFEQALKSNPDNPRIHCDIGLAYYKQDNFDQAIASLDKAKSLDAKSGKPNLYLGMIYEKQGDVDMALREYGRCYKSNPFSRVGRQIRARMKVLIREQLAEEAKQSFQNEKSISVASIPENTVAVLYFHNLSGVVEWATLQKGLARLLITDLARVKSIRVVERLKLQLLMEELKLGMSGMVDESTAPRVGKLLGAKRIINGAIASLGGERMRLDALYTEVETEQILSQRAVQGNVTKFFTLEKNLAFKIIDSIGITLTQEERDAISKTPTESFAAFLAYCRGLDYDDREMYKEAAAEFQRAAQLDPNFIQAGEKLLEIQAILDYPLTGAIEEIDILEQTQREGELAVARQLQSPGALLLSANRLEVINQNISEEFLPKYEETVARTTPQELTTIMINVTAEW